MYWLEKNHKKDVRAMLPTLAQQCRKKGLLLIDDDEWFRALFKMICESQGVPLTTFSSLADMPSFASLKEYDLVILDYYLESFKGPEIAEYVDVFFSDLPVVVISGEQITDQEQKQWPRCIRRFACKTAGPYSIIAQAMELLEVPWPAAKAANLN